MSAEAVPDDQRSTLAKYVAVGLGALVLAVGLVVVLLPSKTPDISFRTLTVQATSPTQVVVTFEVTKAPLASAECSVTATGPDREIVDRLVGIRIGPSPGQRTTTHTVTVPTGQRATNASVATCVITRTR
ncbi:MAG TPA: DUF4307 domain-containing protein [Mycobacteriales bacterium]|nr:DUF4307 domain-containing protein [Mycobacteriales bacterium]